MAKRVRDAQLESRAARGKLKAQGKPYYKAIGAGLHVGYRKGKTGGVWVVRVYTGDQNYLVQKIGVADDVRDKDGATIFDFYQAQDEARAVAARVLTPPPAEAPLTVADVVTAYVATRDSRDSQRRGRAVRSDASRRLHRYVLGQDARGEQEAVAAAPLAAVAVADLTEDDLKAWRAGLPASLAETTKRRLSNDLKAALHSKRKHMPTALLVGDGLKGIKGDGDDAEPVARDSQILSDAQVVRLLSAARQVDAELGWEGDLFRLVVVLNATGARFSQIARMKVRDCQLAEARLLVPSSRKGKGKGGSITIPVEPAVIDALRPVVTGRAGDAPLLECWRHRRTAGGIRWVRDGRGPWQTSSYMSKAWKAIRERAEMPTVIAYALRHSSIVRGLRQNLPIRLVAALHDTSVAMIERHYSKWVTSGLEELARKVIVPLMPPEADAKVVQINSTKKRG